jgi:hypothetical protein
MAERRPRIPEDLAERIDVARGDVPFERFVRRALEAALGPSGNVDPGTPGPTATDGDKAASTGPSPASPRAPAKIGKCWEPWCEKKGPVGEACPNHPIERFR